MPCRIFAWAVLIFFLSAAPAWSWSGKGHRIVGAIADEVLKKSPVTKAKVKDILGGHTLATVSVWADCAKGFRYCQRLPSHEEHAYSEKNPEHHNFHYTDIPYQQNVYSDAGAGAARYDIVHVIGHAVAVLRGNASASDSINLTQREALWVLAHVVGDIQQPLHVAALYFDKDCGPASPRRRRENSCVMSSSTFEPNYEPDSAKVALRQLGKAGFRLAALLTAIFEAQ